MIRILFALGFLISLVKSHALVNFVADYSLEGANEGFNDPTLGASRKLAFEHALSIWGSYINNSYTGEQVVVRAEFNPLGGSATSATLGSAGPETLAVTTGTFFADAALANHIRQTDVNGGTHEINVQFNSDVDGSVVLGSNKFYYGTDKNSGSDKDFVSLAMHEIAHGLGFSSDIKSDGSWLNPTLTKEYDRFLYDAAIGGTALKDMTTNAARLAAITSGNLYWGGANAVAAYNGNRVKLYAPNPYEEGSSVSHVDEGEFGHLMLSPQFNGNLINHKVSDVELGMMEDMGWDVIYNIPEPSVFGMLLIVAGASLGRRRNRGN